MRDIQKRPGAAESAGYAEEHPGRVVLFSEGQPPRGVYVLCARRVKLSTSSRDARVPVTDISGPGDLLEHLAFTGGGAGPRGGNLRPAHTHEETGQFVGASRETVTRFLSEFKRRKVIEVSRDALTILDRAALEAFALPR